MSLILKIIFLVQSCRKLLLTTLLESYSWKDLIIIIVALTPFVSKNCCISQSNLLEIGNLRYPAVSWTKHIKHAIRFQVKTVKQVSWFRLGIPKLALKKMASWFFSWTSILGHRWNSLRIFFDFRTLAKNQARSKKQRLVEGKSWFNIERTLKMLKCSELLSFGPC